MPAILKKTFLFHYNPTINSDKVFNVFVIDNEDGTFSAISEYGRSGTHLFVKPLIENCSLSLAESRFYAKINEKVYHSRTPYSHTLNPSTSPTYKKLVVDTKASFKSDGSAKVLNFKPVEILSPAEKESGQQTGNEMDRTPSKKIGVLNLNQLDALEI